MAEEKKKNIFYRGLRAIWRGICFVGRCIKNAIFFILFVIFGPIVNLIVFKCKIKGRENVKDDDEARVFILNHYQLFGPAATMLNFPYKSRPWIIDKMMDGKTIEKQMGLLIYSQFQKVPKFIKFIVIKLAKNLMLFFMHLFKGIPVSRDNLRANLKTMQISTETLNKGKAVLIFPEKDYVAEGVGYFMQGFEHIGKYYYQKTGKKISFYPTFVSESNRTIYIDKPIVYDPSKNENQQKTEIVKYLRDGLVNLYFENEVVKQFKKDMRRR